MDRLRDHSPGLVEQVSESYHKGNIIPDTIAVIDSEP
jgi:hypothetical protein